MPRGSTTTTPVPNPFWDRAAAVIDPAALDNQMESLHAAGFRPVRFNLVSGGGVAISEASIGRCGLSPFGGLRRS